jgi:hypothetical protein
MAKKSPLGTHFQSREQPDVTRIDIRRLWWLGDKRNAFPGEELLHQRCGGRCVIVMQKTFSQPLVAPFAPNCIAQTVKNFQVEMTFNSLSWRY